MNTGCEIGVVKVHKDKSWIRKVYVLPCCACAGSCLVGVSASLGSCRYCQSLLLKMPWEGKVLNSRRIKRSLLLYINILLWICCHVMTNSFR